MKLDVVFIVGPARTGTSVLTMCLKNSGYKIGKHMLGHKYPSQDRMFMTINREIKRLLYKQLLESKQSLDKPIVIGKPIHDEINKFWRYAALYRIEAVKDPLFYEIFGVYWNASEIFRDQKFIWTHRNKMDAAKSAVRLKYMAGVPEKEPYTSYTTKGRLKRLEAYDNIHKIYFDKCNGINIEFEDIVNNPLKVKEQLSKFLGKTIDTSIIDEKETYQKTGLPQ